MQLAIATQKSTGFRYYYGVRRVHGATYYTADCAGNTVGEGALAVTWHKCLGDARKTAAGRGTLLAA